MPSNDVATDLLVSRASHIQTQLDDYIEKSWPSESPALLATVLTYQIGALVVRFGHGADQETTEAFLEMVIQTLRSQVHLGAD
jgi:hypothetical protein